MFVASIQELIDTKTAIYFPLLISTSGILGCFLTSIFGIFVYKVGKVKKIEFALKLQLAISTILTLLILIPMVPLSLPSEWKFVNNGKTYTCNRWYAYLVTCIGLIAGFLIGLSTDYYTSNSHSPVQEMAESCKSGAAINIIYGLAVGYMSTVIPVLLLSATIIIGIKLCGMFGMALGALGMLSTLCVGLAIDAYGPISDNAGGIAEMAGLHEEVRERTDALDAAGNTTAAIGKGFAIGSACLVSLSLYGAFVTRSLTFTKNPLPTIEITNGWIFGSLLAGGMLPYAFSALTMKAVGRAANEMVENIREQLKNPDIMSRKVEPDYTSCIEVSTRASLREMVMPGLIVILTPICLGVFIHPVLVAGVIPGALISGIQMAISMSNTGGAWDNAKKYIEAGNLVDDHGMVIGKRTDPHTAAVIGDTVGDPLKDTSGPSLNILIKLMAIIALVFASGFSKTSWLGDAMGIND